MDIAAIRASLSAVALGCGFNAWDFGPDDPQNLPAAVVGGIKGMDFLTMTKLQAEIGIIFYTSSADPQDSTRRLDKVLSLGDADSFLTQAYAASSPAWSSIRFISAGPYQRYAMPSGAVALGVELILEVTG